MAYTTNKAGIISAGPFKGFYPAEADRMQKGAIVRDYTAVNGQLVHTNHISHIIDTQGALYGKYPAQVNGGLDPNRTPPPPDRSWAPGTTPGGVDGPQQDAGILPPATGPTTNPSTGISTPAPGTPVVTPPGTDPASVAAGIAKDNANRDAMASIKAVLGQYGLESLSDFAWQEIVAGRSGNEVLQDLQTTPQFQARFPAIAMRQKAGLPPLSPGDYVSYENSATQYMRDAGLPKGFYDSPSDFTQFLANDVSLKELASRVDLAKQAAYQTPPEVRTALRGQFGLGDGDLAAFFLDPNKAEPLLQRTFNAAQIAGAGVRTGYNVSTDQDYRLTDQGVSTAQAQSGFDQLQHEQQLFNPLVGSNETSISSDQQLAAQFSGNAQQQDLIERRRSDRQAEFQAGGAFGSNAQGLSGFGAAQQPR